MHVCFYVTFFLLADVFYAQMFSTLFPAKEPKCFHQLSLWLANEISQSIQLITFGESKCRCRREAISFTPSASQRLQQESVGWLLICFWNIASSKMLLKCRKSHLVLSYFMVAKTSLIRSEEVWTLRIIHQIKKIATRSKLRASRFHFYVSIQCPSF